MTWGFAASVVSTVVLVLHASATVDGGSITPAGTWIGGSVAKSRGPGGRLLARLLAVTGEEELPIVVELPGNPAEDAAAAALDPPTGDPADEEDDGDDVAVEKDEASDADEPGAVDVLPPIPLVAPDVTADIDVAAPDPAPPEDAAAADVPFPPGVDALPPVPDDPVADGTQNRDGHAWPPGQSASEEHAARQVPSTQSLPSAQSPERSHRNCTASAPGSGQAMPSSPVANSAPSRSWRGLRVAPEARVITGEEWPPRRGQTRRA